MIRRDVNYFARTSIMELLAGFFLDSFRIRLQLVDLLGICIVFFLELTNFFLQTLVLGTFSAVDGDPVCAQYSVYNQPNGDNCYCSSCGPAPYCIEFFQVWRRVSACLFRP